MEEKCTLGGGGGGLRINFVTFLRIFSLEKSPLEEQIVLLFFEEKKCSGVFQNLLSLEGVTVLLGAKYAFSTLVMGGGDGQF